ncbi:hypothetical protein VM1G_01123 [Cytospora mali]|uniref:LysM domain-containing protein n=1 Tax=Cytospora mali TaxID=578113 RepID=A0A194VPF9_CYTMA|nr:hypothetical protein VM1G_01123 [Valsa mali]
MVECCSRVICGRCIHDNPRFASYCPYCQIASEPSTNPLPQGLREPPPYDIATSTPGTTKPPYTEAPPPPYTSSTSPSSSDQDIKPTKGDEATATATKTSPPPEDTLHFVHPTDDTIPSLSIRYNVPAQVLRRHNNLTSDHLLSARRTVLIPGSHYPSGVSLSPRPVEGEDEEARRAKIRRWMVGCKCADYDVAELYLGQSGYDLDAAVAKYLDDERWEREHPLEGGKGKGKGKGKSRGTGGGTWAAQAAFLRRQ